MCLLHPEQASGVEKKSAERESRVGCSVCFDARWHLFRLDGSTTLGELSRLLKLELAKGAHPSWNHCFNFQGRVLSDYDEEIQNLNRGENVVLYAFSAIKGGSCMGFISRSQLDEERNRYEKKVKEISEERDALQKKVGEIAKEKDLLANQLKDIRQELERKGAQEKHELSGNGDAHKTKAAEGTNQKQGSGANFKIQQQSGDEATSITEDHALRELLSDCLEKFWMSREREDVEKVFSAHANTLAPQPVIDSEAQFGAALRALGLDMSPEAARDFFGMMDLEDRGGLDLAAFHRALRMASTPATQWATSLPLAQLLGRLLDFRHTAARAAEPLREVSQLGAREVEAVVGAFADGARTLLTRALANLAESFRMMDGKAAERAGDERSSKFSTIKMSAGRVEDFHKGLAERTGLPRAEVEKAMMEEHCVLAGCDEEFTAPNYGVVTRPRKEYGILLDPARCPPGDRLDRAGREVRVPRSPEHLLATSPLARAAALDLHEVRAVVLYTGPMFVVYNAILRRFPEADLHRFTGGGSNRYATTIFVLVSAVVKIARAMKLPTGLELFRGTGGRMELPESFNKPDALGRVGFMEYGFLSTTAYKEVAIQYSGVKGGPMPMVLRIVTGSIDRGACIAELSQYPGEREFLWVPCSFIAPDGPASVEVVTTEDGETGVVTLVPARINANLKTETVDQLIQSAKLRHLENFRYQILEVERDLEQLVASENAAARLKSDPNRSFSQERWVELGGKLEDLSPGMSDGATIQFTVPGLVRKFIRDVEAVRDRQALVPAADYHCDWTFRGLVEELLRAGTAPLSAMRHYLENVEESIESTMRSPCFREHTLYLAFLWRGLQRLSGPERAARALQLCALVGLVSGEDLDAVDWEGLTPLMRAAQDGAGERSIQLLMEAGATVDLRDKDSKTAFIRAAQYGHCDLVRALARRNADVNALDKWGSSAVWMAAQEGHVEVVEALAMLKANIHIPSEDGRTPLFAAARDGHLAVVDVLLRLNADINTQQANGRTPLFSAAAQGHAAVVEALAGAKADLEKVDQDGRTAVLNASIFGHIDVVEALARFNANIDATDGMGLTPLWAASSNGHASTVEALVRLKANVNSANGKGQTPVYAAAALGHLTVVESLVRLQADVNIAGPNQQSLLWRACSKGSVEVLQALARGQAHASHVKEEGMTPIFYAIMEGNVAMVEALVQLKADVNTPVKEGFTPLAMAMGFGHEEVAAALRRAGASE